MQTAGRWTIPAGVFRRSVAFVVDRSLLLLVGTAVALVWANLDLAGYHRVADPLHFVVNDIGMVFFFGLAAKEVIEATASGGALHSPRRAGVPLAAAVGGMVGPAAIYVALAGAPALLRGWAIPCATDIAFSYLVARTIFGPRHPAVPFLLLLAIADDALGLIILALVYPTGEIRPFSFAGFLILAMALAWALRRQGISSFWPYVVAAGAVSWLAFYRGGLHPALALIPVLPFVPHASPGGGATPLQAFEHWWKVPVQFVLFFFGLVNAGVSFGNAGPGTWIVLAAILVGKPLGILLSTEAAVAAGLHRPDHLTWRDQVAVGFAAAIGLTVALFFATAAFRPGSLLDQTKMGALFSLSASVLAAIAAWTLGVGRFAGPHARARTMR